MSQTKYPLPKDVKMRCISMVRDYERMVKRYHELQKKIACESPEPPDGQPRGNGVGDSCFYKAQKLIELDKATFVIEMRAIEQAKVHIGIDIMNEQERKKLTEAIWDSCIEGRNFNFEYRVLCVSKTDFYERRRKFLYDIAKKLEII